MTNAQKERLRHVALEFFALRQSAAFSAEQAARMLRDTRRLDFHFSNYDLADALTMLVGLGYMQSVPDPLGSTIYYQVTASGILFYERGTPDGPEI